jgi:hypothetical protein
METTETLASVTLDPVEVPAAVAAEDAPLPAEPAPAPAEPAPPSPPLGAELSRILRDLDSRAELARRQLDLPTLATAFRDLLGLIRLLAGIPH